MSRPRRKRNSGHGRPAALLPLEPCPAASLHRPLARQISTRPEAGCAQVLLFPGGWRHGAAERDFDQRDGGRGGAGGGRWFTGGGGARGWYFLGGGPRGGRAGASSPFALPNR